MYNEKSYLKFFGKKFMLLIDQVLQFVRKNLFTFQSFFFGDMTPPQSVVRSKLIVLCTLPIRIVTNSPKDKGSLLKLQLIKNTSKHLFHCKISVKLHTSLCKQYLDKRKKKPDNRGPTALFFNWYVVIRKRLLRQFSISCSFNLGFVDG